MSKEIPNKTLAEAERVARAALEQSKDALTKLPILGPALWLYARDPMRKYMFLSDIDAVLLPPVVLDQCRLYSKESLPFAFVTWAFVNEVVDARFRSGQPRIAPHEWKSGSTVWLVDVVAPFGQAEEIIAELRASHFPDNTVCALLPDVDNPGTLKLHQWPALRATRAAQ